MCHISHNKYKKDKNAGRNETGYSEETINEYNNYTLQDLQDIELLQTQWKAQLILVLVYLLEYTASVQGINILQFRIKRRNEIFQAGQYGDKEESELINEVADECKRAIIEGDSRVVEVTTMNVTMGENATCIVDYKLLVNGYEGSDYSIDGRVQVNPFNTESSEEGGE